MESGMMETVVREQELLEENPPAGESDLPPEYCRYRDEGCELAASCLSCPFPQCVYDEPGGRQHWLKKLRNREISRLFCAEGKGAKELASMFGLSQRTIQRALKNSVPTFASHSDRVEREKILNEGELLEDE